MSAGLLIATVSMMICPTASTSALKTLQAVQTVCVFLIPAYLTVAIFDRPAYITLRFHRGFSWQTGATVILLMLVASPGINLLGHLNEQMQLPAFLTDLEAQLTAMEEAAAELTERFLQVNNIGGLVINLLVIALLPALAEETCFRCLCQTVILQDQRHRHLAIWVTAILFSAIHMQFYGFIPRMLIGALFGYLLVWSGSLWLPVLAHFVNNANAVILYYIVYHNAKSTDGIDAFGTGDTLWVGIVSLVLTVVGIYLLRRSLTMSNASSRTSSGN